MAQVDLWVEKYRPKTIDEYVFKNEKQRKQVESWVKLGQLPGHLMLSGVQGTGKTSLALMLFKEFGVPKGDVMMINASEQRGIDTIRDKIINFCSTWSLAGGLKYVLLDEADMLTPTAQPVLRNVMEKYHETTRFVFTCNYPQKIIPALHSRTQGFHFDALDKTEFIVRVGEILTKEEVEFEFEVLEAFIDRTYPDMRKCINLLQQHTIDGSLFKPSEKDTNTQDYLFNMVDLVKKGYITKARLLVTSQARPEEYDDIYRFMYNNLELWGESEDKQRRAILIIAEYLKNDVLVADREINLAACFVALEQLRIEE